MKHINLLFAIFLSLNFTSFAITNNGGDDAVKERMQVDAYAKANIECEYQLAQLEYRDSNGDKVLKVKLAELKTDVDNFRQLMFIRYSDEGDMRAKFTKLVDASTDKLTTCKKLDALQKSIADAKAAALKASEEKSSEKK